MKSQTAFFKWIAIPIIFSLLLSSVLVSPSVSAQDEQPPTPTEIPTEEEPVVDDFPEPTPQPTLEEGEGGEVEGFQSFSVQTVITPSPADPDCSDGRCVFIVSSSSDDAGVHPNCTYSTTANEIYMGQCTNGQPITSGFRFPNINIPQGTVIQNAYLEFTLDGPYTDELNVVFYGQNSANALPFTNTSRPSNRPIISTYPVYWHIPATESWSLDQIGMPPSPPSITPIIQEIVNRPDWVQGNAIAIILRNVGPSSGTFKHRRVIAYDRFTSTYGATNAARLVIELEYDCSDYENTLSDIGQVVLGVVGEQNYCLNKFENLTFIENNSTGVAAFEEFANLASNAKYEIDFTTMIWDKQAGDIFLQGIKDLYEKVKLNPNSYPSGVQIRILLGLEFYTIIDQRITVIKSLEDYNVPLFDLDGKWKIEVASYRNSKEAPFPANITSPNNHSHVKLLIVDGQTAIASGYNLQTLYLLPLVNLNDIGIKISGPVVQDSLKVFDEIWYKARALSCDSISCEYVTENSPAQIFHLPEVLMVRPSHIAPINAFSLFRNDDSFKSADDAIVAALKSANLNANIIQNSFFENSPPDTECNGRGVCEIVYYPDSIPSGEIGVFPYTQAIIDGVQNGAQFNLLLSTSDKKSNAAGIHNLRDLINLQTGNPSLYSNINVRFTKSPTHTKAFSIDGQFVVVGSQNFHYSAFGDDPNNIMDLVEYSYGIDSQNVATEFDSKFWSLWDDGKPFIIVNNTIQETIDLAPNGSIIYIPSGVYNESLVINKPITLLGQSIKSTIINADSGIRITSSGVTITNLRIRGGVRYGVILQDVSINSLKNILINNVVFENNVLGGIYVEGMIQGSPIQFTFENNTFVGGQDGVTVNLLETQIHRSYIRNNIFINQSYAPINIVSAFDDFIEYSFNSFSLCALSNNCIETWRLGNIVPLPIANNNLFNLDPQFIDPAFSDYQLSPSSPLIDSGDPNTISETIFDGNGDGFSQVDIGAFESFLTLEDLSELVTDDAPNVPGFITEISPNKTNLRYFINPEGDEDWFKFSMAESGNIQIHLTSLPANYDLYVYNAAGQLLGSSTKDKKAAEFIQVNNVLSGYYYVRVVGVDGAWSANNSYQLRFNSP